MYPPSTLDLDTVVLRWPDGLERLEGRMLRFAGSEIHRDVTTCVKEAVALIGAHTAP